ncbi:hypothetical protein PRIC1_004875 [Phytophthora ramorum]|uniref:putative isomerase n=1 Tax=Phytophthora ramorum TaxID=164328 RepID=UPI0030A70E74|nr:putative isomerase [Phytophthora ramorum]
MTTVRLTLLREERDVQQVEALEAASFPAVEAANEKTIRLRQHEAGQFFSVAHTAEGVLVGFVTSTLTTAEGSVDTHDPDGSTLCIRSVVVDPASRRQGIALRMLKQYVETTCHQQPQVNRIVLAAKMHLLGLFIKAGFAVARLSPTAHGQDSCLQLELDCNAARQIPIIQVDAFTREPFQGNPAAVVLLQPGGFHHERAPEWMQLVAREKNLGATAFAAPREASADVTVVEYDIKWFSPLVELTLCGHGTLSTAVALLDRGHVRPAQTVRFYNRTNILICRYEVTSDQQFRVVMNFPCKLTAPLSPGTSLEAIAAALGVAPVGVLDARLALNDVIVRLDKSAFESLTPDHGRINEIETGFVVTTEAPSNHSADFLSRFFAPSIGINEDPVTGSTHCGLGPYWSGILGKRKLTGYQATSVRGGFVEIDLDDAQPGRVLLKCQGVVVACGVLTPSH